MSFISHNLRTYKDNEDAQRLFDHRIRKLTIMTSGLGKNFAMSHPGAFHNPNEEDELGVGDI